MLDIQTHIIDKLSTTINITHIKVTDESHQHNVPTGSQSHFNVVLVSNDFTNKTLVKRHQLVYSILAHELRHTIHALSLHTYTEQEWQEQQKTAPQSPDCLGGKGR
ncbi:MAG: BolA/IbaG family iron-sulfur metabolism protein [Candidatus Endonucleobacter bathymodioli]|uniref:BolA/IbaG family iron-sulfur metabolism protein n=1 Tax=Candidatus Endonucleibacter bathymodioli TaxID=539814 RepID=A0AA90NQ10_9GAMM|nr:BolA/IbaG family iron-sulfur metabolism protein [Candidatus Endonucleobacter bathymodioli]